MNTYHKIENVFRRDMDTYKLIEGVYSSPEFSYLEKNFWVATEKVDGMNVRVIFNGESFDYRGKSDRAVLPNPLVEHLTDTFTPLTKTFSLIFPEGACIYGEGYGGKIQKGTKYSPTQSFVMFDIKVRNLWYPIEVVIEMASLWNIAAVPIVLIGTLEEIIKHTKNGFDSMWGRFPAEGVIAKPRMDLLDRFGNRIITKIKTKDFA